MITLEISMTFSCQKDVITLEISMAFFCQKDVITLEISMTLFLPEYKSIRIFIRFKDLYGLKGPCKGDGGAGILDSNIKHLCNPE